MVFRVRSWFLSTKMWIFLKTPEPVCIQLTACFVSRALFNSLFASAHVFVSVLQYAALWKKMFSCFLTPMLSLDTCTEAQPIRHKLTTSFISMLCVLWNSHLSTVIHTGTLIYWYQHEAGEHLLTSYFNTEGKGFNRRGRTFVSSQSEAVFTFQEDFLIPHRWQCKISFSAAAYMLHKSGLTRKRH